jgi:hypothetical protein
VLVPFPHGTVRHTGHTVTAGRAELDRFLADVGEPVPDLGFYAMWTVARDLSGEVDSLADSSTGTLAGLERVADRPAGPLRRVGALPVARGALPARRADRPGRADVARERGPARVQ